MKYQHCWIKCYLNLLIPVNIDAILRLISLHDGCGGVVLVVVQVGDLSGGAGVVAHLEAAVTGVALAVAGRGQEEDQQDPDEHQEEHCQA